MAFAPAEDPMFPRAERSLVTLAFEPVVEWVAGAYDLPFFRLLEEILEGPVRLGYTMDMDISTLPGGLAAAKM